MYKLPHDVIIETKRLTPEEVRRFLSEPFEREFLTIKGNIIRLKKEYSDRMFEWDGATGARDGEDDPLLHLPITWIATSIHDANYRYRPPIPFKTMDLILYDELIKAHYRFGWNQPINVKIPFTKKILFVIPKNFFALPVKTSAGMYYLGVRWFGWIARWARGRKAKAIL